MEFNASERSTLGIEVEYGIVDRASGRLVTASNDLLTALSEPFGGEEHPKAKHELFQSSLEVITGICETPDEAAHDLASTLSEIVPWLSERNLALESTGTHPFDEWDGLPITDNARYLAMVERLQWPAQRLLIHGVHVHVGVRSGEKAITTTNVLAMYLPILLALSASSPYWLARDTGMASARTKVFEGMPTTGIPPQLKDWQAYEGFVSALLNAGTIESIKSVWWDIRPHPGFGTVELRMCDGINSLTEIATVAAIAQCLVTWIDRRIDAGDDFELLPEWELRENKWRASRWGLEADLITDQLGSTQPLRQRLDVMLTELAPIAAGLGCAKELEYARTMSSQGASYQRQRDVVAAGGSLQDVVQSLIQEADRSFADYGVTGAAANLEQN